MYRWHAFSYEWFGTKSRFARGKSQIFIHELLREPLIFVYSWVSRDVTSFAQISVRHVGVFMLITDHFFSEAPLLSLTYFANYLNIQKEKTIKVPGIHLKVSQCSLSMPKA